MTLRVPSGTTFVIVDEAEAVGVIEREPLAESYVVKALDVGRDVNVDGPVLRDAAKSASRGRIVKAGVAIGLLVVGWKLWRGK